MKTSNKSSNTKAPKAVHLFSEYAVAHKPKLRKEFKAKPTKVLKGMASELGQNKLKEKGDNASVVDCISVKLWDDNSNTYIPFFDEKFTNDNKRHFVTADTPYPIQSLMYLDSLLSLSPNFNEQIGAAGGIWLDKGIELAIARIVYATWYVSYPSTESVTFIPSKVILDDLKKMDFENFEVIDTANRLIQNTDFTTEFISNAGELYENKGIANYVREWMKKTTMTMEFEDENHQSETNNQNNDLNMFSQFSSTNQSNQTNNNMFPQQSNQMDNNMFPQQTNQMNNNMFPQQSNQTNYQPKPIQRIPSILPLNSNQQIQQIQQIQPTNPFNQNQQIQQIQQNKQSNNYLNGFDPTKKQSKNVLSIVLAKASNTYSDEIIKNHGEGIAEKTKAMVKILSLYCSPMCFIPTFTASKSQCNQSVYHYPISHTRKTFSLSNVETSLNQIAANLINWHNAMGTILATDKSRISVNTYKTTMGCCAAAAKFLSKVLNNTKVMLYNLSKSSKRSYPSLPHGLYQGDYSELFAFLLLRYLYRVDRDTERTIQAKKQFGSKISSKKASDLFVSIKRDEGKPRGSVDIMVVGNSGSTNNPQENNSIDRTSLNIDNILYELNNNEIDKRGAQPTDDSGRVKKRYNRNTKIFEPKYEVGLRPTRGTKILLFTDPNFFVYNLKPAIARGICLLAYADIIPKSFITDLRICSTYTGGLYQIRLTKKGMLVTPIRNSKTLASLPQQTLSQSAIIFDVGHTIAKGFDYMNEWSKNEYVNLFITNQSVFENPYDITTLKNINISLDNLSSMNASTLIPLRKQELLTNIDKLVMTNKQEYAKALTSDGLLMYEKKADKVTYTGTDDTVSQTLIDFSTMKAIDVAYVKFDNLEISSDISADSLKRGYDPRRNYLRTDVERRLAVVENTLSSNPRAVFNVSIDPDHNPTSGYGSHYIAGHNIVDYNTQVPSGFPSETNSVMYNPGYKKFPEMNQEVMGFTN